MSGPRPLLFVGHGAERSGPPIFLLHFLRWLSVHRPDIRSDVLLLNGGPLLEELEELTRTVCVFPSAVPRELLRLPRRALRGVEAFAEGPDRQAFGPLQRRTRQFHVDVARDRVWAAQRDLDLRWFLRRHGFDARNYRGVYVNTTWCGFAARRLPSALDVPILTHVHELGVGVELHTAAHERRWIFGNSTHLLAASEQVRDYLVRDHGLDPARVTVAEPMVDTSLPPLSPQERREERVQEGLDPEAFLVGMGGTTIWRKGPDLFVRLVWELARRHLGVPVEFVWIGGDEAGLATVRRDLADAGVGHLVHLVGQKADPIRWYSLLDTFVLPAREDAYPMACLEAASVGVPLVCFDTGGMASFARRGAGLVAPYPDVAALADHVAGLAGDPQRVRELGACGARLARQRNAIDVAASSLVAAIDRWLPER